MPLLVLAAAGLAALLAPPSLRALTRQEQTRPEQAKPGLDIYEKMQTEFNKDARFKLHQQLAQWYWVDFVVRAEVFDEAKIAGQRHAFGGYDWYSVSPQGVWNKAFQRA